MRGESVNPLADQLEALINNTSMDPRILAMTRNWKKFQTANRRIRTATIMTLIWFMSVEQVGHGQCGDQAGNETNNLQID